MGCEKHQTRTYRFVIGVISIGVDIMRCPTMEINRNGQKVVINTCDFDIKTMLKWGEIEPVAPAPAPALAPAPAPAPALAPAPAPKLIT